MLKEWLLKEKMYLFFIGIFLLFVFMQGDLLIFSEDGYTLWLPIVQDYLRGDEIYRSSPFIFNGQNLLSIYGQFPFWRFLRWLGINAFQMINLTFLIWWLLASWFLFLIYTGIKGIKDKGDISIILLYTSLSPIVMNRLVAGHFNLLFGMLPLLVAISLIFNKTKINLLMSFFGLWCSMSIQSYQLIAYHIFYIPILLYFIRKNEVNMKKYFSLLFAVFISAFIANIDVFKEMYNFALSHNSQRQISENMTYSYTVSTLSDLAQFFITKYNIFTARMPYGFFHELNYAAGFFLVLYFVQLKSMKKRLILLTYFMILFGFCMNVQPFNLLSKIPVLNAFRVPQRVFMLPFFLVPPIYLANVHYKTHFLAIISTIALSTLLFFVPFGSIIAFLLALFVYVLSRYHQISFQNHLIVVLSMSALFCFFPRLYLSSRLEKKLFDVANEVIQKIKTKEGDSVNKNVYHIVSSQPHLLNYVSKYNGIKTIEGYGHPPKDILKKYESITGHKLRKHINSFYIEREFESNNSIIEKLGITRILEIKPDGNIIVKKL